MKKLIALLFLFSYLFSTTQLYELLKVNILVEHYADHASKDAALTVWGFLRMHYSGNSVKDADYEQDMKLPFKSLNICHYASINFCTPIEEFAFSESISLKLYKNSFFKYNFYFSSNFHSVIWQPPKSC